MSKVGTLLHRWFEEVWNKGNEAAIDEMLARRCVVHGLMDEHGRSIVLRGITPFKKFYRKFQADFRNIRVKVEEVVVQGNHGAARCVVTARDRASGKRIRFTGMTITHWEAGKIARAWNSFDFHAIEQQLR